MSSELYEPLVERDLDAFTAAARSWAEDDLWVAVARFAVLAYAPSQHSKRSVMAVRAAHENRGDRYFDLIVECARYAAESRQPWSEPPILDPPAIDDSQPRDLEELREAIASGDRARAERWLAARIDDCEDDLKSIATGDAALMLDTALALIPLLGEKGRHALLRMPILEMLANPAREITDEPLDALIARAIEKKGSIDSVRAVFVAVARAQAGSLRNGRTEACAPYTLARDYAQTLIAHAMVRRFPPGADVDGFLAAVHENLEHGESYAEWSFA